MNTHLAPTAALVLSAVAAHAADQLNIQNGCTIEAIRFLTAARATGTESQLVIINDLAGAGDHAVVVYRKGDEVWSHDSMLGDRKMSGVKPEDMTNGKKLTDTYTTSFNRTKRLVDSGQARWEIPDSRQGDTEQKQVARAQAALAQSHVQNAVMRFDTKDGGQRYALVFAMDGKATIYSPQTGSITLGQQFSEKEAQAFARDHLNIAQPRLSWVRPEELTKNQTRTVAMTR